METQSLAATLEVSITRRAATAAETVAYADRKRNFFGSRTAPTHTYEVCVNGAVVASTFDNAFAVITARRISAEVEAWNAARRSQVAA